MHYEAQHYNKCNPKVIILKGFEHPIWAAVKYGIYMGCSTEHEEMKDILPIAPMETQL